MAEIAPDVAAELLEWTPGQRPELAPPTGPDTEADPEAGGGAFTGGGPDVPVDEPASRSTRSGAVPRSPGTAVAPPTGLYL